MATGLISFWPLSYYGTPDNFSTQWIKVATIAVTAAQNDPISGSNGYLINDTDGTNPAFLRYTGSSAFLNDGEQNYSIALKAGTATTSSIALFDTTAGVFRHTVHIKWPGGAPVLQSVVGAGQLETPLDIGRGFYLCRFSIQNVTASNQNDLRIYPASTVSASVGNITAYNTNMIVMGTPLYSAKSQKVPHRHASEFVYSPGGYSDAWIPSYEYLLAGNMRWIPPYNQTSPFICTGWYGENEYGVGVNVGIQSWLTWGQNQNGFIWCANRNDLTINTSASLSSPLDDGGMNIEENGYRSLSIEMHNNNEYFFGY